MKSKKEMCCDSCSPMDTQPQIVFPPENETVRRLTAAFGQAKACSSIQVFLDGTLIARSRTDTCGHWQIPIKSELSDGSHYLCVTDCDCRESCAYFSIGGRAQPLPAPVISYPTGSIPESSPRIYGTAEPGATVRVCVDNAVCTEQTAGSDGTWNWQYPDLLAEGYHVVTAASISPQGARSRTAYQVFFSEGFSEFQVTLTDAHEGSRFRTVALELTIASTLYPVTLYYLLLPPGSPAPDEDEIRSYTGPSLLDGTAARGSVELYAGGRKTVELNGRENAPSGALGVVDNLRYDVYVVALAGEEQSAVLSSPDALSMPFAGGRGIQEEPYLIAGLSREEILSHYPDLAADKSPLGVDDTARMLRNINSAQALYESSGGIHGIRNSMSLDYHLTTAIELSGYANAEGGMGWTPLGYQAEYETPRYFSGLLSGENARTPIRGLTVIREGLRELEGLFAASLDGEFEGLILENSVIRLSASDDPEQRTDTSIGLLVTNMQGGSLKDITITGAEITISDNGFNLSPSVGGITRDAYNLRTGERLLVEHLNMDIPRNGTSYGSSGGMFASMGSGSRDSGLAVTVLDTLLVKDSALSALGVIGGVVGSLNNPSKVNNVVCERCDFLVVGEAGGIAGSVSLDVPGILFTNLQSKDNTIVIESNKFPATYASGGLFGNLWMDADDITVRASRVDGLTITGPTIMGGFIGYMNPNTNCLIEDCHVAGTRMRTSVPGLGGFCARIIPRGVSMRARRAVFRNCTVELLDLAEGEQVSGGFAGQCSLASGFFNEPYKVIFEKCESQTDLSCTGEQVGGFIGLCNIGSFVNCRAAGRVTGAARTGGFAGEFSQKDSDFEVSAVQCKADTDVFQSGSLTDGGFGGFAGYSNAVSISQCGASGIVTSSSEGSSALLGEIDGTAITDCYSTGSLLAALNGAGGLFGLSSGGRVERCYSQGSITGGTDTGGIGGYCSQGETMIQNNLVLSPTISGSTPTGRILGGGTDRAVLKDNYAVTTLVLQDGQQKPIDNDPNGPDGGTITTEQTASVMESMGWPRELWDYHSAAADGRPKLYHMPGRDA